MTEKHLPTLIVFYCILSAVSFSSGCGTLFSDKAQMISISSEPAGAEVLLDGVPQGFTPVDMVIERSSARKIVSVRTPSLPTKQFALTRTLNAISILNLTSVLSWATDLATGGMFEYAPNSYFIDLNTAPPRPPGPQYSEAQRDPRRFVLVNHKPLATEIAKGGGEYLRATASLFEVDYPAFRELVSANARPLLNTTYPIDLYRELERLVVSAKHTAPVASPMVSRSSRGWVEV